MTAKIIIKIEGNITASDALQFVTHVVADGMVSKGRYGEQYCHATKFKSKLDEQETTVYADKTKSGTHTFLVTGD